MRSGPLRGAVKSGFPALFCPILLSSWSLAAVLATVASWRDHLPWTALATVVVAAGATACWLGNQRRRGALSRFAPAVLVLLWFPILPELALRAYGFHYVSGIRFGYPSERHFDLFVRNADTFWTFDPADPGINSWGFAGPEIGPKPRDVRRVLFLGDSCTIAGHPHGYPQRVAELLNQNKPADAATVECVSLAVPGYSSYQGKVLAAKYGRAIDPDCVVVYYGWNDHWRAYGTPDSKKRVLAPTGGVLGEQVYASCRLLQFTASKLSGNLLDVPRVSLDEFRANLAEIAHAFPEQTPVVFITAPTGYHRFGVDRAVVEQRAVPDAATAIELHDAYTAAVRRLDIAPATSRLVFDLAAELEALPTEQLHDLFFFGDGYDGIHFSPDGREHVAQRIAAFLTDSTGAWRTRTN